MAKMYAGFQLTKLILAMSQFFQDIDFFDRPMRHCCHHINHGTDTRPMLYAFLLRPQHTQ